MEGRARSGSLANELMKAGIRSRSVKGRTGEQDSPHRTFRPFCFADQYKPSECGAFCLGGYSVESIVSRATPGRDAGGGSAAHRCGPFLLKHLAPCNAHDLLQALIGRDHVCGHLLPHALTAYEFFMIEISFKPGDAPHEGGQRRPFARFRDGNGLSLKLRNVMRCRTHSRGRHGCGVLLNRPTPTTAPRQQFSAGFRQEPRPRNT